MTVAQVSDLLQVPVKTIYNWWAKEYARDESASTSVGNPKSCRRGSARPLSERSE